MLYASAAVEAFCAHGIPARYVEGYYLGASKIQDSKNGEVSITGENAHAWVEVYFDGVGWNALMAALHYTEGDFILGMDDDMQTHPSQISKLIHKMEEGYDLVYGCYPKRKNSFLKNVTSKLNEVSSRILLGRPKDIVSSNFWMITRQIKDEVVKYDSFNPYIDGIFYRTTHKIGNVEVEHFKRAVGTSNYTLKKLIKLWLAYWNYSVIPLRISSVLGGVSAAGGFLAAIMIAIRKLINPTVMVGWSSTICAIVVFSGLILMVLGIIGEYLGKMILILNRTPQYIVRETINVSDEEEKK